MEHEYKYQALASTGKKVRTAATYMGFINHFCLRFFVLFASLPQPGERVSCLRNVLNIIDFFYSLSLSANKFILYFDVYVNANMFAWWIGERSER